MLPMITQRSFAASSSKAQLLIARASAISSVFSERGWRNLQLCGQWYWWFLETNRSVSSGLVASKGLGSFKGLLLMVYRLNPNHFIMGMPFYLG